MIKKEKRPEIIRNKDGSLHGILTMGDLIDDMDRKPGKDERKKIKDKQ